MKVLKLDPPLNLAGLSVMGMAEKGMNNPLPETPMNERRNTGAEITALAVSAPKL